MIKFTKLKCVPSSLFDEDIRVRRAIIDNNILRYTMIRRRNNTRRSQKRRVYLGTNATSSAVIVHGRQWADARYLSTAGSLNERSRKIRLKSKDRSCRLLSPPRDVGRPLRQ